MITRDEIKELAEYESPQQCALTFYYQPSVPKDQSHREEVITLKDLVREALREADKGGRNECARADLNRILDMADNMHGNGGKAKAIFADSANGFWREFDIPPRLEGHKIVVNRKFHLKPLVPLVESNPRVAVCLADRTKARLIDYHMGEGREILDFFNELPRHGEGEGWAGYDAGHIQRAAAENTKQHYKRMNDILMKMYERGGWDAIAFGCRDESWPEIEDVLHSYVTENLLGHFRIDPKVASIDAVVEGVERLLRERDTARRDELIKQVIGEAHRNGNGALGLRRVLRSLETGEMQTLLLGDKFSASGSQCTNCGHIEMGHNEKCSLCGQDAKQISDLADLLISEAMRNGIDIVYVRGDEEFDKAGHIAGLLRFRADQNTPMKLAG